MSSKSIYIPRKQYILFQFKSQSEASDYDVRNNEVMSRLNHPSYEPCFGKNKTKGWEERELRQLAMDKVLEITDGQEKFPSSVDKALREHRSQKRRDQKYIELYKIAGEEVFYDVCEKDGVDGLELLSGMGCKFEIEDSDYCSWSACAVDWLNTSMSDGLSHKTKDIRNAAVSANLIDNSSRDWNKLRMIASRYGFTSGSRAIWKSN